ncbi:hypothetical protein DINM_002108 [Dirofilaria immitis]|nr:hypothetical protein [Dirofilaria immitis]
MSDIFGANMHTGRTRIQGAITTVVGQTDELNDIICFDGTLTWKQDWKNREMPCYAVANVKLNMDWNKADDYCKEIGGELPTPTETENALLETVFKQEFSHEAKIPLGFVNENNKWMQIRDVSITEKQQCDDGFVLFAINNVSKCYLFHEFADPFMDASDFTAVLSYCKFRNAELFEPIDSGDLHVMQKIGEATGYTRLIHTSSEHIYRQYGYINRKVNNDKEEPITAAGYKYAVVGIDITGSNTTEAFCFMLELPGGSEPVKVKKFEDVLETEEIIITDLKPEITLKEVDDLSYLGVATEAKRSNKQLIFADDNSSMNVTIDPILYGMRIERRLDDDYFNFVTRLAQNQKNQRVIIFGEHLSNISRFWFSVDFTSYLNVQIERRIDDRILQCTVDTETVTHSFPIYIELMIIAICAMLSATFSGLTTGLMALSTDDLKLIAEGSEDKKEREYASNILPLRAQGNFLLCSIVLGNTICNIVITLLISDLCESIDEYFVNPWIMYWQWNALFNNIFMVLSAPISYPFSLVLDLLLGKEGRDVYDRKTLRALITMQQDLTKEKLSKQMDGETTDLVLAAFDLPEKIVRSVMTPIDNIFMLSDQSIIDKTLLKTIAAKGRTRIPIYSSNDRNTITAILNMKDLLPFCTTNFLKVGTVVQLWKRSSQFRFIIGSMPVLQLLIEMRNGIHIAMVFTYDEQKRDYIVQGLVTLEDLIEEVVGEIFDEQDVKIRRAGLVNRNWRRMHTNI